MKIAELPDGRLMQFPDDFPDNEMDAAVREALGVPEEPDPVQLVMQLSQQVLELQSGLATLIQQNQQQMAAIQQETAARIENGLQQLAAAMTAPRTIINDGTGKPVGVTFGAPGGG